MKRSAVDAPEPRRVSPKHLHRIVRLRDGRTGRLVAISPKRARVAMTSGAVLSLDPQQLELA